MNLLAAHQLKVAALEFPLLLFPFCVQGMLAFPRGLQTLLPSLSHLSQTVLALSDLGCSPLELAHYLSEQKLPVWLLSDRHSQLSTG